MSVGIGVTLPVFGFLKTVACMPMLMPNATRQALPEADARYERTLEAVACTRLFGVV
jgi:hypothetical protein